jgi:hypothetical protein
MPGKLEVSVAQRRLAFAAIAALLLVGSPACDWFRGPGEWRQTYDLGLSQPIAVLPAADSGFTVVGWKFPEDTTSHAGVLLVRCTADGDTLWTRCLFTDVGARPSAACQGPDGSIYVGGEILDGSDGFVARISATGDSLWLRRFDFGLWFSDVAALASTADGGVIAAGRVDSIPRVEPFLAAFSPAGEFNWNRPLPDYMRVLGLCRAPAGWYVVGYDTTWSGIVALVDESGELVWSSTVSFDSLDIALNSVVATADGCVACGEGWPDLGDGITTGILVRLNEQGGAYLATEDDDPKRWYEQIIAGAHGFYAVGSVRAHSGWKALVARVDPATLETTAEQTFGDNHDCYGFNILQGADGALKVAAVLQPDKKLHLISTRF